LIIKHQNSISQMAGVHFPYNPTEDPPRQLGEQISLSLSLSLYLVEYKSHYKVLPLRDKRAGPPPPSRGMDTWPHKHTSFNTLYRNTIINTTLD
jgi:hypothetical protein